MHEMMIITKLFKFYVVCGMRFHTEIMQNIESFQRRNVKNSVSKRANMKSIQYYSQHFAFAISTCITKFPTPNTKYLFTCAQRRRRTQHGTARMKWRSFIQHILNYLLFNFYYSRVGQMDNMTCAWSWLPQLTALNMEIHNTHIASICISSAVMRYV